MVQRLSRRQLELYGKHAADCRDWSFPAVAVADPTADIGDRLPNAGAGAAWPAPPDQSDSNKRWYGDPNMTADLNQTHQAHAHDHPHAGAAPPSAVAAMRSTRYTCPMHPEIVR